MRLYVIIGILLPFFMTSFGSLFIFFIKNELNNKIKKLMIGLSIGVMLSSSIFSLLIPSIELSKNNCLIPSIGIILGFIFLIIINNTTKNNHIKNMTMMSLTLHNIPEGMVVGAAFAGLFLNTIEISFVEAMMISLGIAIQNIPEGLVVSISYKINGSNKIKSFIMGVLSGIVEPIFAVITILVFKHSMTLLPYLLSFSFGSMIYVILNDLVIDLNENKSILGSIGIIIGFIFMMILDISFG